MKHLRNIALSSSLLLIPLFASAQVLPVQQTHTENGKKNWSWAASVQAVLWYFGVCKSQAEIGNYGTNDYDVPNFLHGNGDLNRHGVDEILFYFAGIESNGYDSTMIPEEVFSRINHFRAPILIRWAKDYGNNSNTGAGDRIVVIKGARYQNQVLYLMIMDPVAGTYEKEYEWVVRGSGHIWTETLEILTKPSSAYQFDMSREDKQ